MHLILAMGLNPEKIIPVAYAKLVLVGCDPKESLLAKYNSVGGISYSNGKATLAGTYYKPILISLTEKIEVDNWSYDTKTNTIRKCEDNEGIDELRLYGGSKRCFKLLVLPEHFSPQTLQDIVDGKLKDGSKVLLEVEEI